MAKDATPAKLAELHALAQLPRSAGDAGVLRRSLRDRSNSVVAKAAALVPLLGAAGLMPDPMPDLVPDLVAAFERLMRDGAKNDPQCTGKIALLKALRDLDCAEAPIFFRAARHVQWEPVWGGRVDTGVDVRAVAGHALTGCATAAIQDIYLTLVDLMADPEARVRAEAALAVGRFEHSQSELLLRLKIRSGDQAVEVMGACFDALLQAAAAAAVEFVASYLADEDEALAFEAASALGASRLAEAFDLLLARIEDIDPRAEMLVRALVPKRGYPELRARIAAAVELHGGGAVRKAFAREFPSLE